MNKHILIIGANGFIGKHFCKAIQPKCYSSQKNAPYYINLKNPSIDPIPTESLRFAIIAAGCANIADCENRPKETHQVNVKGTLRLVKLLLEKKIFPILFSSDYVFSGKEGHYLEDSSPSPTTAYGRQKEELEARIDEVSGGNHLMLRLSKIYSLEPEDGSLLDEIGNKLSQKMLVKAAVDQVFCPLAIDDLVAMTLQLIKNSHRGLFNIGGKEKISRFELTKQLAAALNVSKTHILPIQLNDLNPLVSRPQNTSLISEKVFNLLNYVPIPIKEAIKVVANYYRNSNSCRRKSHRREVLVEGEINNK